MNSPILPQTLTPRNPLDIWNAEPCKGCSLCDRYAEPGSDFCILHQYGPRVEWIEGMIFRCESFTRPGIFYRVHLGGAVPVCACPAKGPCKHIPHTQAQVERLHTAQVRDWASERLIRRLERVR